MKPRILILLAATAIANTLSARNDYDRALESIALNNPTVAAYAAHAAAEAASASTGLAPANPEVELGYLWGEPGVGNRKDISVSQELEFPTVYACRRALARSSAGQAHAQAAAETAALLLEAKNTLIELAYNNGMQQILAQRLEYARQIRQSSEGAFQSGQITVIDYNKAALNLALAEGELRRTEMEIERLNSRLAALNGGTPLQFTSTAFPDDVLPADRGLITAEGTERNRDLNLARSQATVAANQLSLARSGWIPKFTIGYSGEFIRGGTLQGITLGIAVPLWENRGAVRAAQAAVTASKFEIDALKAEYQSEMSSLISRAYSLNQIKQSYEEALQTYNSDEMTMRAYRAGEISLHEYADQMQYTLELRSRLLETGRDLALALAQIYKFAL